MNPTVYIETSVVSYLTARPSRNVVVAAYQEVTREWWRDAAARFNLVASELVAAECRAGDRSAAHARLEALEGVALLAASPEAEELAPGPFHAGRAPVQGRSKHPDRHPDSVLCAPRTVPIGLIQSDARRPGCRFRSGAVA